MSAWTGGDRLKEEFGVGEKKPNAVRRIGMGALKVAALPFTAWGRLQAWEESLSQAKREQADKPPK